MKPRTTSPDSKKPTARKPKGSKPARPRPPRSGEGPLLPIQDGPVDSGGKPWTGPPSQ